MKGKTRIERALKTMNCIQLSKEISYALRHKPEEYGLQLDEDGFVSIDVLLCALNQKHPGVNIALSDIEEAIRVSDKKRHEIVDDRIRALYGHSTKQEIVKGSVAPPSILYHGTSDRFLDEILKNGLLPMNRKCVHLSLDLETASSVGLRHGGKLVILKVDTGRAQKEGTLFYLGSDNIYLSTPIAPDCLSFVQKTENE